MAKCNPDIIFQGSLLSADKETKDDLCKAMAVLGFEDGQVTSGNWPFLAVTALTLRVLELEKRLAQSELEAKLGWR